MRNLTPLVAGAAALFLATATPPGVPSAIEVAGKVIPSVHLIDMGGAYGSGSVIECTPNGDGTYTVIVLTAKHVIVDEEDGWGIPTMLDVRGKVIVAHDLRDIALCEFTFDYELPTIPGIRMSKLSPGEEVFGFGYGLSRQMWVTHGIASTPNRAGFAAPGDSGGATVDKHGYLVGVTVAIDRAGWNDLAMHHCYIEPTFSMIDWLNLYADVNPLLR
jgi:S1-C subfamily serine protease